MRKIATIRHANITDIDAILAIIKQAFPLSRPSNTKQITIDNFLTNVLNNEKIYQLIKESHSNSNTKHNNTQIKENVKSNGCVLVAETKIEDLSRTKVVGLGIIEALEQQQAEFSKLYIDKDYHGYGFGKQLANAMISEAKQAGIQQLELYVYKHNDKAKGLYKRLGFTYSRDKEFHIGDEIHDDEQYILQL